MSQRRYFADAIQTNPFDATERQVFADWLEEQADLRGACVRLLPQLGSQIGPLALYRPYLWQSLLRDPVPDWLTAETRSLVNRIDDQLGDGRKTAVLLALAIVEGALFEEPTDAQQTTLELQALAAEAAKVIDSFVYRPKSPADILRGLNTAALGLRELSEPLLEAFAAVGQDGVISIVKMAANEASVRAQMHMDEGIRFPFPGCPSWVTQRLLHFPVIFVSLDPLGREHLEAVLKSCETIRPVLCVCPDLTPEGWAFAQQRYQENGTQIVPLLTQQPHWTDLVRDLAVLTGAIPFEQNRSVSNELFGYADSITIDAESVLIQGSDPDPDQLRTHCDQLRENACVAPGRDRTEAEFVSLRLARLLGGIGKVQIYGKTEREVEEGYDKACAALHAGRALIGEGGVAGGGAIYAVCAHVMEQSSSSASPALRAMIWALQEPLRALVGQVEPQRLPLILDTVCKKKYTAYDVRQKTLVDVRKEEPLDSAAFVRGIIRNATETAARILTKNHR